MNLRAVGISYSRGGTATDRLQAGGRPPVQLNTVCVCVCGVYAGMPAQLHIACCRICTYAFFQLSHCQPQARW